MNSSFNASASSIIQANQKLENAKTLTTVSSWGKELVSRFVVLELHGIKKPEMASRAKDAIEARTSCNGIVDGVSHACAVIKNEFTNNFSLLSVNC